MNIKSFFSPPLYERGGWEVRLLLATFVLASCTNNAIQFSEHTIQLNCAVNGAPTMDHTRVALNSGNLPAEGLPVCFARSDEQDNDYFTSYTSATPLESVLFPNGDVVFSRQQLYQDNAARTRFVGWYPMGALNEGQVTFALDGITDVMLTNESEGSLSLPFNNSDRSFTFAHLLAQLQVVGYVMVETDIAKYGKITSVTLAGQPDACTVALPSGAPLFSGAVSARMLKNPADDTDMAAVSLSGSTPAAPVSCGYLLFPPGDSALNLTLNTENYEECSLSLSLSAGKVFEAGKTYTVRLLFGGNGVTPEVLVADWNDAERTIIDIERIK